MSDAVPEGRNSAFGGFSQAGLELGESHLDRIEVWRIGRQIEQLCADSFDPFANAVDLMSRQVVHDDDVALGQAGHEEFFDINEEGRAIHWSVQDERRNQAIAPQAGGECRCFPMTPGRFADQAPAFRAASAQADHVGAGPGLVDEHQPIGVKLRLLRLPVLSGFGDVGPVLLAGVQRFF